MNKQQIGKKLKQARESKYKLMKDARYDLRKEPHQIKSIEAGSSNYTIDTLLEMCEKLDLELTIGNKS